MSETESATLIARDEQLGKTYPMFLERGLLLIGIIIYLLSFSQVIQEFNTEWIGLIVVLTVYPFLILFTIEVIGRIIQRMHNDVN